VRGGRLTSFLRKKKKRKKTALLDAQEGGEKVIKGGKKGRGREQLSVFEGREEEKREWSSSVMKKEGGREPMFSLRDQQGRGEKN